MDEDRCISGKHMVSAEDLGAGVKLSPQLSAALAPTCSVSVTTSPLTLANVASDLPEITPVPTPTPATGTPGSPVADTSAPEVGTLTLALNVSAATAQVFGLIVVALALTLAATKLVADSLTPRRNAEVKASSKKPGDGKGGTGRTRFFGAPAPCRRGRSAARVAAAGW